VHLALVFGVFIAVAIMVMVFGRRDLWPSWYRGKCCVVTSGFIVVDADTLQLQVGVSVVRPGRVDTMLV